MTPYKPRKREEAAIQETCCALLALDGWRRIKTDLGHLRGMGVSEPGMADDCFIRYRHDLEVQAIQELRKVAPDYPVAQSAPQLRALCDVMWIEWKKPKGGRTQQNQHDWHAAERARGALTWKAGEDFPPTIEGFAEHYNQSGLALVKRTIGAKRR